MNTILGYLSVMKAYSLDLRERVVSTCQVGQKHQPVADQFSVSFSFMAKLLDRHRTSGSVATLRRVGDPPHA